jgi:hypothetical protein
MHTHSLNVNIIYTVFSINAFSYYALVEGEDGRRKSIGSGSHIGMPNTEESAP